jgi:hypothetical protein
MSGGQRPDDPNAPVIPIPEPPPGLRDGRGTPIGFRTPPQRIATSNTYLVVLGLIVVVVLVALFVASRG